MSSMSPSKDHFSARARSTTGQNEGRIELCGELRLYSRGGGSGTNPRVTCEGAWSSKAQRKSEAAEILHIK